MKHLYTYVRNLSSSVIFVVLFIAVVFLQVTYDTIMHPTIIWNEKIVKYVMPASLVTHLSFGFKNVIADYYWINNIQDFAGWDHVEPFYIQQYENLTRLDPYFSYPYLFGILTIPSQSKRSEKDTSKAEPLAISGIKNLPLNWEIPFYMGTMFQLAKVPHKTMEYLSIAAARPLVPPVVTSAYTSYKTKKYKKGDQTENLIRTIYDTTTSKTTKEMLENQIYISDLTRILTTLVANYKKQFGVYPSSLDEMIAHNVVQISPEVIDHFAITIDGKSGVVEIKIKEGK